MIFDTIYKRTSTGATQTWWQELVGNKYRTHSGQQDGAIVVSEWTTCQGKNIGRSNETSPSEQAKAEVEANYVKKLKEGYYSTAEEAQGSTRFSPMLAKPYADYADEIEFPVWAQPKLDGIRCIATRHGLKSRKGNPIVAVPHIERALRPLFADNPGLMLDGELYNHELRHDFNSIVSAVKKTKPTQEDLEHSEAIIQYHVYDSPGPEGFGVRICRVRGLIKTVPLIAVATTTVTSQKQLDELYAMLLEQDYEGQIVRMGTPYEQKRTRNLLKRKEFIDSEFTVLDIVEGIGNKSGMAGAAVLDLGHKDKRTFRANIKGNREFLRNVLAFSHEFVGKKATVEYFTPTPDGIPRFPRIKSFHVTPRW